MLGSMQSNTLQHYINRAMLTTIYEHMVVELRGWGILLYMYTYADGKGMKVWRNISTSVTRLMRTWKVGEW